MFPCAVASPRLRGRGITCGTPGPPCPSCACSFQRRETASHKLRDDGARLHEPASKFRPQARGRRPRRLQRARPSLSLLCIWFFRDHGPGGGGGGRGGRGGGGLGLGG